MVLRLGISFLVSMVITFAAGIFLIPALRRMKAGQSIREDGPVWHNKKQGTPTMGGVAFIAGTVIAGVAVGFGEILKGTVSHLFVLLLALVYAAIGFLDDYEKLKKQRNLGLTAKKKFVLQLIVAIVFLLLMRLTGYVSTVVYIPFANASVSVPWPVYYIIAAILIVGTVNAVNITDGVDGLATGVSIPVALCFTLIAFLWGYTALGVLAAALAGGFVAFLLFNFHPAKVFMGDTGAHFIGGAICAIAFAVDAPLILIPLGIVYYIETLSDIIQIVYYKATHGKRVFKMAPLHHHLEMCGWSEYKLFTVFTLVSVLFAALSYYGVYYRYG